MEELPRHHPSVNEGRAMNVKLKMLILQKYGRQCAFSSEAGRDERWISALITGRRRPTADDKALLKEKLGVEDVESLFSGQG
jgi:hypothetical protein